MSAATRIEAGAETGEQPKRILIVSADMGEGHNATARALEQRCQSLWPACELRRLDTLEVMGPGVGPLFRRIYIANVQRTPWLYEFFYASLQQRRWFADASKRFVGSWCGRRLAPMVAAYRPDLILSTYPLGSAGLDWLRRHRVLQSPTGAWISDFAPHPFWVYPSLDAHLVMHELAVPLAQAAVPGAQVAVCAPPVVADFAVQDRSQQRRRLGLDPAAFLAVVSCGAFGFGTVESAVQALLAAHPRVQVVVACGRNDRLRRRLQALGQPEQRLLALGWVQDMPTWTSAADIVVTNAGGATALEALASQRAIIMFDPIAAHGRANAELMAQAGLAVLCRSAPELTRAVADLVTDRRALSDLESAVRAHLARHDLDGGLLELAASRSAEQRQRLRSQDVFFLHVETDHVAQQAGAVLSLAPTATGHAPRLDDIRAVVAARLPGLPMLRRRLVPGKGWTRPSWSTQTDVDLDEHLDEVLLHHPEDPAACSAAVDDFFSTPLDRRRPLWQARLIRGLPAGRSVLVIKVHHSLGDGLSVIGTLSGLLDKHPTADPDPEQSHRTPGAVPVPGQPNRSTWRRSIRLLRGLGNLVLGGTAPRSPLNGRMPSRHRHIVTASLPAAELRGLARRHGVRTSELAIWLAAAATRRVLSERSPAADVPFVRAMIPLSHATARRTWGNWTGALPVDIPMGPMPETQRLARISSAIRRQAALGTSYAAQAVLRLIGAFPTPLHARLARLVYRDRWFNLILSFMPGAPSDRYLAGARLAETYPVLPVAEGVGLSIGLMSWAGTVGVGITADPDLVPDADRLRTAVGEVFDELSSAPPWR